MRNPFVFSLFPALILYSTNVCAQESPSARITNIVVQSTAKYLEWNLVPAADEYEVLYGTTADDVNYPDRFGTLSGNRFTLLVPFRERYWRLQTTTLSSNVLLSANILNRVAYGPTPDDLDEIAALGPQAYLDEQLNPETLPSLDDSYTVVHTNGVTIPVDPGTDWISVSVTGRVSSSRLYMYLRGTGEMHIDDVELRLLNGGVLGPNVIENGDFEQFLSGPWNVSANLSGSFISTDVAYAGLGSLRMISTQEGSTRSSSIWQDITPSLPTANQQMCVLSFKYLPSPDSHLLTIRLSGSGTVAVSALEREPNGWIYATATGTAANNNRIYLYISGSGEAWIDDMKLVAGATPEFGPNLLANGAFESPLGASWVPVGNHDGSVIDNSVSFTGAGSLKLVATGSGTGSANGVVQDPIPGVEDGEAYTVSYWYLPGPDGRRVTVRLSGGLNGGLLSEPDRELGGARRLLDTGKAELEDLRAWFVQNAVGSKQQLLQILLQFLENHFVTQHSKTRDYFDGRGFRDGDLRDQIATAFEFREIQRWRDCLLRPGCTFHDLLQISAESPAMIIYLDTVESRADGDRIANENYARELYELFCMGVDNGYDQNDIVAMSRAWTGWRVEIVNEADADNPFAERSQIYGAYPGNFTDSLTNVIGVWTFNYQAQFHGPNRAPILSAWNPNAPADDPVAIGPKLVDARFGEPWALTPYQLAIPPRTGTNSIQDGYDVLRHLADLPYTMEYISVKLCRLFVHDDFRHGVYDYTDPDRSPEADLVHRCMTAWWNSEPKGQLRPVLQTIFDSDLFRSHGGSMQKVKTPLEFAVSAIRALRAQTPGGGYTAGTDGYDITGTSRTDSSAPLTRMGTMLLFDRADPDGYPEDGPPWISAGTLAERLRYVQSLLIATGESGKGDGGNENVANPVELLMMRLPAHEWGDPRAVSRLFLRLLFPGEGLGNLNQSETLAVNFLNQADDGSSSSFTLLPPGTAAYDTRVRGMVAMLMSLPRFQEQ